MVSRCVNAWKVKTLDNGEQSRSIRMRMAMRGFKDGEAATLETYSGTATLLSQKLLRSEVACHHDWEFRAAVLQHRFGGRICVYMTCV